MAAAKLSGDLISGNRLIWQVVEDARLPIEVEEYVNKCSPELIDVVVEWCNGAKFVDIVKMTDWCLHSPPCLASRHVHLCRLVSHLEPPLTFTLPPFQMP